MCAAPIYCNLPVDYCCGSANTTCFGLIWKAYYFLHGICLICIRFCIAAGCRFTNARASADEGKRSVDTPSTRTTCVMAGRSLFVSNIVHRLAFKEPAIVRKDSICVSAPVRINSSRDSKSATWAPTRWEYLSVTDWTCGNACKSFLYCH